MYFIMAAILNRYLEATASSLSYSLKEWVGAIAAVKLLYSLEVIGSTECPG